MSLISALTKEIDERIDEMWLKPPREIENLKNPNLSEPNTNSLMAIASAYYLLRNLGGFCWGLRSHAKANRIPLAYLKPLAASTFEDSHKHLGFGGLPETADLFLKAAKVINDLENVKDFIEIMDRLCVYCNKYSSNGWLDILMQWHKLSCVYEALFK